VGAFAERLKFSAFLLFAVLWATIVYDPLAHWVWAVGGFLRITARSTLPRDLVHISAGMSALAAALVVGRRRSYPDTGPPHNLALVVLGAALLWFGWFGFNGAARSAPAVCPRLAFVKHAARRDVRRDRLGVPRLVPREATHHLGLLSGLDRGLAAVTPASGFVSPMAGLAIGAVAARCATSA